MTTELHRIYESLRNSRINNKLVNFRTITMHGDIKTYMFDLQHGSSIQLQVYWGMDPGSGVVTPAVFVKITNFCNEPELSRLMQKFGGPDFRITFNSLHRRDGWVERFITRCKKIPTPYQRRKLRAESARLAESGK